MYILKVFGFFSLILHCRFIHLVEDSRFCPFSLLSSILLHNFTIYSLFLLLMEISEFLGSCVLAITFLYLPSCRIAEPYDTQIFNFGRWHQTFLEWLNQLNICYLIYFWVFILTLSFTYIKSTDPHTMLSVPS